MPAKQHNGAVVHGHVWRQLRGVFTKTFADKTNDSRFDGTFTSVYRGNWTKNSSMSSITTLYNANNMSVSPGDAILSFLPDESLTSTLSYTVGKSNIGAGVVAGRADYVIPPSGINRQYFPGLWKIGTYRTDNGTGFRNSGMEVPVVRLSLLNSLNFSW